MLGISTLTNPVQKPLLQDDLFDAEYSSSEDECDKPEQPQSGQLDSHSSRDSTDAVQDTAGAEKCTGATDVEKDATDDEKDAIEDEKDAMDDDKDVTNGKNATDYEKDTTDHEKDATEDVEKNKYEGIEAENSAGSDDDTLARPSPMERAKTKKQKASERQNISRRVKQKAIEQIHSESQRIIRESKLVIPYHTPKPLSLNEFFSKKPNLTQIKAPQALSRILQSNTMKEKPSAKVRSKHSMHRRTKTTDEKLSKHTTMKLEDPKLSEPTPLKPEGDSEKLSTNSDIKDTAIVDSDEDADKLVLRLDSLSDDEEMDMKLEETDINLSEKIEETTSEGKNDEGLEPPLQGESQDWSLRLDTQSVPNTLPEPESPVKEMLCTGSKMKSSLTDTPTQHSQDSESNTTVSKMIDSCEDGEESAQMNDVMVTPVNKVSQSESSGSNKKRLLEMLKGYDTMVPKLGGNGDAVINFDSDDEMQPSTGVNTLMERFIKHSTKKYVTKKKHVQLEVVKKELNSEGKEELVHELVPVTLGEDEQKDPKLETPGAKLLKLKENLQVKMKAQREIERQRRIDAYRLDNEEGYEEDEHKEDELGFNEDEEEAELTDGSETDGDYEPGEAVDDDYDDDDDSDTEEKNIFLDGQAKEDDKEELPAVEINNKKQLVSETNDDNDSDDEFVFKIRKKKRTVVEDEDDEEDEEKCVETHNGWKNDIVLDKSNHHDDTSTISSSSVKSLFKNPIRYSMAADGKTMDLFDSSTNTTDRSEDTANLSVADGCSTSVGAFSFTPIKEKKGLIRHKSTDFANTPDSDEDEERKDENDHSKEVDSRNFLIPSERSINLSSSFDNSSAIPPYQPTNSIDKSSTNTSSSEFIPRGLRQNETVCKMGGLTLPIEDSQDLFQQDFSYPQSASSAEIGNNSQNLHLSFEDNTQTQFLDENGFLKVKTQQASSKSHKFIMPKDDDDDDDENAGDMDELLGLCSGQFTSTLPPSKPSKGIFSQLRKHDTCTPEMDELLQLCSGTFTGKNKHEEVNDDVSESSFQMLSDNESVKSKDADGFSDNEEDKHNKDDNEELGGINEDEDLNDSDNEGLPTAKKIFKNKFIEEEAELSGSEFGSDEEYDAEEFGDLIAEEMINEDVGNEGDIHNKIQKMHMKLTDDEDARRLRLYKEAFLTDGDLHDGSKGRTRQFRWRNVDDDSWMSGVNNNSDDEAEEEENENELEWRKQRHEREQCIKSQDEENKIQDEEDCLDLDENSQFDKFIKKVSVKRRKKSTVTVPETNHAAAKKTPTKPKMTLFKHGSFLNRAKNDLERITNMFKPLSNPNRPRNARNFVFQSLSPQKADDTESASQMKRPLSNVDKAAPNHPKNKKARLSTSQPKQAKSIFQLF